MYYCTTDGPNEKDRQLLVEFDIVIDGFLQLKPAYQAIIADITKRMGDGMAHYATAGIRVETIADYDEYCHYVAGLVGLGLSDIFSACGECKTLRWYHGCVADSSRSIELTNDVK